VDYVVGPQPGIVAVTIRPDCNREKKRDEICQAANSVDLGNGVIIVTDMFGGSPSNLSLSACNCSNRRILYGANLPLLVKLAKCRKKPLPDAIAAAIDAGRKYMDCLPVNDVNE
jgi:PTS system mannose-specific IIA component